MSEPLKLRRLPNWRSQFHPAMCHDRAREFSWGKYDCLVGLVAPAILAITGYDIAAHFQQYTYTCAEEARAHIRAAGFRNIADGIATLLPEVHPSRLTIGDIAAVDSGDGWLALGVCIGERIMVLSPTGMCSVGLLTAKRGFKVG